MQLWVISKLQQLSSPQQTHSTRPVSTRAHSQPVPTRDVSGSHGLDGSVQCTSGHVGENWVCLTCFEVHCSRYVNEHMLLHGLQHEHRMVLSFADLSVWCYACEAYVHNKKLMAAKRAAHISKFQEDMPGHYWPKRLLLSTSMLYWPLFSRVTSTHNIFIHCTSNWLTFKDRSLFICLVMILESTICT